MLRLGRFGGAHFPDSSSSSGAALAAERIDLSPNRSSNNTTRVSIELEAGGHSLVRVDSDDQTAGKEQKLPMSVAAKLQYDERSLAARRPTLRTQRRLPFDTTIAPRP